MELGSLNQASTIGAQSERAVYVFDSACRYLRSAEEGNGSIAGKSLEEIFPEAEARALRPYYLRALNGETGAFEQRQGSVFTHHSFAPLPVVSGRGGIHALHRWSPEDESAKAVQSSDLRHDLLIAGSSAGIWEWTPHTKQMWLSPRFFELLGFAPVEDEQARDFWRSRTHPQDLPMVLQAMERHLQTRAPFQHEYRLRIKSGEYRWFLITGQAFWDDQGRAVQMAGSINDIHARHLLEEERELQFDVIFEQAYELMAILSPQGRLKNANRALLGLLGCQLEEVREQFFWNLPCWKHHPESPARLRSAILLAGEHQDVRYEEAIQGRGRRANILDLSVKPIFSHSQELLGLIVEGRDITPLKQAQQLAEKTSQMLLHHNRQLENFAHITSHNLRSPATNIHMLLSYYDHAQNAKERDYALSKLNQSSRRLLETLDILSDNLSIRMDTHVAREELRFETALARNLERLSAQIIESEAEIIADFSLCPRLEYPSRYLDSILINLLSNAIKYRHPQRRPLIRLHSWQEHQRVNLRVSDNGLGINLSRHQDKIFGLYKTFHRNPEARGVGLFLIKSQIEALGGSIRVKSEPNQGTTFHIVF